MSQRFKNIIKHYKNWKANNPDRCIENCINQAILANAVERAALSVDASGKKHRHQYRLQRQTLAAFANNLINNLHHISTVNDFEELIQLVRAAKILGIGELAVYDVAVRIGAYLNIWPEKIYLHAGTRVGTEALIGNVKGETIEKDLLPADFRSPNLSCYELEDMLCIYKKLFIHAKNRGDVPH